MLLVIRVVAPFATQPASDERRSLSPRHSENIFSRLSTQHSQSQPWIRSLAVHAANTTREPWKPEHNNIGLNVIVHVNNGDRCNKLSKNAKLTNSQVTYLWDIFTCNESDQIIKTLSDKSFNSLPLRSLYDACPTSVWMQVGLVWWYL